MGLYVKLCTTYYQDPKMQEVSEGAELLYLRGLCLAKGLLTDGRLTRKQLAFLCLQDAEARAAELVAAGLWEADGAGGYTIHAWLKHNPSVAAIQGASDQKSNAGRASGAARRSRSDACAPDELEDPDDVPDETPPLPVAPEWDIAAVMASYRAGKAASKARHNDVEVERVIGRLHQSQAVATELGGQLTTAEACQIMDNWLEHRHPVRVTELPMWSDKWKAPAWLVCLRCFEGKANAQQKTDARQSEPEPPPPVDLHEYARKMRESRH